MRSRTSGPRGDFPGGTSKTVMTEKRPIPASRGHHAPSAGRGEAAAGSDRALGDAGVLQQQPGAVVAEPAGVVEARRRIGVALVSALVVQAEVALVQALHRQVERPDEGCRDVGLV